MLATKRPAAALRRRSERPAAANGGDSNDGSADHFASNEVLQDVIHEEAEIAVESFGPGAKQALWKRFKHARAMSKGERIGDQQGAIAMSGARVSEAKKHFSLVSFVRHGGFRDIYFHRAARLAVSNHHTQGVVWRFWKQACDAYGDSKAKCRLKAGTLPCREFPSGSRYSQFVIVTEGAELTTDQRLELEAKW